MLVACWRNAEWILLTHCVQARIQGLESDLNMNGQQYNVALQVFFILYIMFEVPSNIFIRKISPSTWLSGIMFGWGNLETCSLIISSQRLTKAQVS